MIIGAQLKNIKKPESGLDLNEMIMAAKNETRTNKNKGIYISPRCPYWADTIPNIIPIPIKIIK